MVPRPKRLRGTGRRAEDTRRRQAAILAAILGFRRAFTGFHRLMSAASRHSLSTADALALHFIAHAGNATPGEIAAFTGLSSGAVTTMLDRLERGGFIGRKRSTRDRRVVVVNLRPGAHRQLAGMMIEAHEGVGRMFEGWSAGEVEALVRLLERLQLDRSPLPGLEPPGVRGTRRPGAPEAVRARRPRT